MPMLHGVEVRSGARFVEATIEDVRYEIPEAWLMGACQTMEFDEALFHWHEQAQMAEAYEMELERLDATHPQPR